MHQILWQALQGLSRTRKVLPASMRGLLTREVRKQVSFFMGQVCFLVVESGVFMANSNSGWHRWHSG